jgi:hypothetical protein
MSGERVYYELRNFDDMVCTLNYSNKSNKDWHIIVKREVDTSNFHNLFILSIPKLRSKKEFKQPV